MPHEIKLDYLPAGYALRGGRAGEEVELMFRGFTSFEDGELFISRLEGSFRNPPQRQDCDGLP